MTKAGVSLEVANLTKSWDAVEVLKNVNFDIEPGGFLTLLGPSGCGKSTILRLVSGLDEVSGGQILIGGKDVAKVTASQRNIGMVFQNYALFPHMTIADNITYGLNVRKVAKADKAKALDRVAELMGLGKLLDRKPAQLSGGQQQRVALARVLVSERPLVLMDEPLSNLDAKLRVEIRTEIRSLNKRLGITVVYVTHDQSEALSMSDKVVLMNAGQVAQSGTPQDLYEAPANTFAASFIGTPPMNLLPASDVTYPTTLTGQRVVRHRGMRSSAYGRKVPARWARPVRTFATTAHVHSIEYEGKVLSGAPEKLHPVKTLVVSHAGDTAPEEGERGARRLVSVQPHMSSRNRTARRREFTA